MMRRNLGLMVAVAGALASIPESVRHAVAMSERVGESIPRAHTAGGSSGYIPQPNKRRGGMSVAAAGRERRRIRNRLRSKGQHRKAVRGWHP